jgi:hypothetical protein
MNYESRATPNNKQQQNKEQDENNGDMLQYDE